MKAVCLSAVPQGRGREGRGGGGAREWGREENERREGMGGGREEGMGKGGGRWERGGRKGVRGGQEEGRVSELSEYHKSLSLWGF